MPMSYKIGLDIGSTTIKAVVLNERDEIVYKSYQRHRSRVREMALEKLQELRSLLEGKDLQMAITGSAGLGVAKESGIAFVQEVFATASGVRRYLPDTDVVIELGGEDAKIIFLQGALEERMNSTCAGGTGAFIDQMASLLDVDLATLDELSLRHDKIYPIASRCGVFAKTDIQPLINQGAAKENIAASIFQAVVDQTIAGLAQGRPIKGKVLFLGGPLSFLRGLQDRFVKTLHLDSDTAKFPPIGPYFVALGAAHYCETLRDWYSYDQLVEIFQKTAAIVHKPQGLAPLFANQEEYQEFCRRHAAASVPMADLSTYEGKAYLGVDAGSTTTKTVLIDQDANILFSSYANNLGTPIEAVKSQLEEIYRQAGKGLVIAGSAVTGYGEDLMKSAFHFDIGLVETVAHFTAARHFDPQVDFIIDIGGQDMKCFRVKDDTVDDIILNEACSSGCGSFVETFARSLEAVLPEAARQRLCSAEDLSVRWLQRVTPTELRTMEVLTEVTQDIIDLTFHRKNLKAGTTTTDLEWFMRNTINRLGFDFWFGPDIDLQRKGGSSTRMFGEVIQPGDLLHCDIGIVGRFVQLHTDIQRLAYVLKEGETEVPASLAALLAKGNRLQDIVAASFRLGASGNEIFTAAVAKAKEEGLKPMVYTHPLGTFGHGAGPMIGRYDQQGPIPGTGDRPMEEDTCYALELNIHDDVDIWDGQEVFAYLEEDICFQGAVRFIHGRQTEIIPV